MIEIALCHFGHWPRVAMLIFDSSVTCYRRATARAADICLFESSMLYTKVV